MRLVDERCLRRFRRRIHPAVGLRRLPYLGGKKRRLLILHNPSGICGDALAASAGPLHLQPIELSMFNGPGGESTFPISSSGIALQLETVGLLPLGEIPDEPNGRRIRRPLAEHPTIRCPVKSVVFVGGSPIGETLPSCKTLGEPLHMGGTPLYRIAIGCEPRIVNKQTNFHLFHGY